MGLLECVQALSSLLHVVVSLSILVELVCQLLAKRGVIDDHFSPFEPQFLDLGRRVKSLFDAGVILGALELNLVEPFPDLIVDCQDDFCRGLARCVRDVWRSEVLLVDMVGGV